MTKDDYRKQKLSVRDELSVEERVSKSRDIFEKLTFRDEYKTAGSVLVYSSFGSEVITDDIILDSLSLGKKVFCPKVTDKKAGIMKFVRIYSMEDLEEGSFGIREPVIADNSEIFGGEDKKQDLQAGLSSDIDSAKAIVIVPGAVFDHDKNRLGYGGGFYDRFLKGQRELICVGVCYDCQIIDELLPADDHDVRLDMIISETKIYP